MAKAAFCLRLGFERGLEWPIWSFLDEEFVDTPSSVAHPPLSRLAAALLVVSLMVLHLIACGLPRLRRRDPLPHPPAMATAV